MIKILILCKFGDYISKGNLDRINNISSVYGYFYFQNIKRYAQDKNIDIDIKINILNYSSTIEETFDYCFVLYNRGINVIGNDKLENLKKYINHKIFTIAPSSKIIGKEDILLHYVGKVKRKCLKINWTADKFELYPEQKKLKKKNKNIS